MNSRAARLGQGLCRANDLQARSFYMLAMLKAVAGGLLRQLTREQIRSHRANYPAATGGAFGITRKPQKEVTKMELRSIREPQTRLPKRSLHLGPPKEGSRKRS